MRVTTDEEIKLWKAKAKKYDEVDRFLNRAYAVDRNGEYKYEYDNGDIANEVLRIMDDGRLPRRIYKKK